MLVSVLKYECCLCVLLSAGSHIHISSNAFDTTDSAAVQRQTKPDTGLSTGLPALILLVDCEIISNSIVELDSTHSDIQFMCRSDFKM